MGNIKIGQFGPKLLRRGLWPLSGFILLGIVACGGSATGTCSPSTLGMPTVTGAPTPEPATQRPSGESPTPTPPTATAGSAEGSNSSTSTTVTAPPTEEAAVPPIIVDPLQVPLVDTRIHSVPLDKILFDTFGRLPQRFVPLDQAPEDFIVALRDAIAPIYRPVYGDADALAWLEDDTLVIGYLSGGAAFAYPVNVLNFREIVNDVIDGVPVLITWCPLCGSGVVFNCELDGRVLIFGNTSALFQNDLVMYDHQTGSYWFQVAGEAVVGSLTGSRLKLLPAATNTWGEWRRLHPETRLLTGTADRPTEFTNRLFARERSDQAQVNRGLFAFPVDEDRLDRRLSAGAIVLTVEVGDDDVTAYPLELIGDGAVNDQVGGQPVVVFSRVNNVAAVAFSRVVGDRTLSFEFDNETRQFIDLETGSLWDGSGVAISGPHAGAQLEQLATRRAFWFSIAIAFPDIDLYLP